MRKIIVLFFVAIFAFSHTINAQICNGALGDNIFTEGDFGSGAANVVAVNPMIAPGYIYTTNPPDDGFYTVTNNIAAWSFIFGGWMGIQDNSPDPMGYMMVVNADFSPGLFYEKDVTGLCENTLYSFSADIHNLIVGGGLIMPNVSFLIDGVQFYNTGDIPENQQWNTYGFTFTTGPGQTSVTLALQNNAPGGIGNDLALDNITFQACGPEAAILPLDPELLCEDDLPIIIDANINGSQYTNPVVQWQESFDEGMTWVNIAGATDTFYTHTNPTFGTYYYRFLIADGIQNLANSNCRIASNDKILQVFPKFFNFSDTICEGSVYTIGNQMYTETGVYIDSLLNFYGCDSIVTVSLFFQDDNAFSANVSFQDPSCSDIDNGVISLDSVLNGTPPYALSVDGISVPSLEVTDLPVGDYDLFLTDMIGCEFEASVSLTAPPPLFMELGQDWDIKLGESVFIFPNLSQTVSSYVWEPADQIDCLDCPSLTWEPGTSTTVILTVENGHPDCAVSDSVNINVEEVRNVFIPNVFTPNYDGTNDEFVIFASQPNVLEIESLLIYDRWGALVFEKNNFMPNDPLESWNGNHRGKPALAGVYLYVATVRFLDEEVIVYKGDVTLIR